MLASIDEAGVRFGGQEPQRDSKVKKGEEPKQQGERGIENASLGGESLRGKGPNSCPHLHPGFEGTHPAPELKSETGWSRGRNRGE